VLGEADDEELAEITAIRHRAAVIRRTVFVLSRRGWN